LGTGIEDGVKICVAVFLVLATLAPATGLAARRVEVKKVQRAPLSPEALDKLRELLAGSEQATVMSGVKALADSSAGNAAVPLVELLAIGTRPAIAIAAIEALAKLRDPVAIEVLTMYAGNRGADLRKAAVQALAVFADARVVPVLSERLGDPAPGVRAAAAEALATRNERTTAPRLLAVFKRNDEGVAAPLGIVAPLAMLPTIAELQGSVDDANLATALGELLKRQEMQEPSRLDVVKTLGRMRGAASTTALIEYIGSLPANDTRKSKTEAQHIVDDRAKER
jgi:HEAT repeat protein